MIYIWLILIAIVVVFFKTILLKKTDKKFKITKFKIAGLILLLAGILLTEFSYTLLNESMNKKNWPQTEGIVLSSRVVGISAFKPEIVYRYEIDSVIYVDTSLDLAPGFGGKRKKKEVAQKIVAYMPVGKKLSVYYDPADKNITHLGSPLKWDTIGKLGLGLFLYFLGLFFLLKTTDREKVEVHL